MTRLSASSASLLPARVRRYSYERGGPARVFHLGIGAFHRGHQAAYFDELMGQGEPNWMISGASLRRPLAADQLNPQDGLFTMTVADGDEASRHLIRSIHGVLVAPDNPAKVIAAMAAKDIALVTLTITEKGYCLDPVSGSLLIDDPHIQHDIRDIANPVTAPGFLVAGLAARRAAGLKPFTILSCDNIPNNGVRTRRAVLELAEAIDPELASWIAQEAAFPSSMVDRIVPATLPVDISELEKSIGLSDEGMVKTEPFCQWVVEDWFCAERPPLDQVGVQFTDDVAPWEDAKLRLLNAAHSALAYLGPLGGYEFVHTAMAAPGYTEYVRRLWDEAQTTLTPVENLDIPAYRSALEARFLNSSLNHRTFQIATDGSQKLPQRFLDTIRERRAKGKNSPALTLAVAAWVRWQIAHDEQGKPYSVSDPLAGALSKIVEMAGDDAAQLAKQILAFEPVFGTDFKDNAMFIQSLQAALEHLVSNGCAPTVASFSDLHPVEPS